MKVWNYKRTFSGHDTTDKWLQRQPLWYDSDLLKAVLVGIVFGTLVGFLWGYEVGTPDYSKTPVHYLKG